MPIAHQAVVFCFAAYSVASERSLIKINDSISLNEASLFSCALMTGVGAVLNTAQGRRLALLDWVVLA